MVSTWKMTLIAPTCSKYTKHISFLWRQPLPLMPVLAIEILIFSNIMSQSVMLLPSVD